MSASARVALAAFAAAAVALGSPAPALGHHSFAMYDTRSVIELEGELTEINWRNPHVRFTLAVPDDAGGTVDWRLETSAPNMLGRMSVTRDAVAVGAHVRVAGNPANDGSAELFATNMLLPDGREMLLRFRGAPRWSDRTVGEQENWFIAEGDAGAPELGVFRVWSTTFATDGPPLLFPDSTDPRFTRLDYPLTDEARAQVEAFDETAASAAADCSPKGMPTIMEQPDDMEIARAGDDVEIRIEEYGLVRVVHMGEAAPPADAAPSLLGYSTGAWRDGALTVRTSRVSWPSFKLGVPQSPAVALEERFTPSADGARLDYELTVTDPATFTEPVTLRKHWIWIDGAEIEPYACTDD